MPLNRSPPSGSAPALTPRELRLLGAFLIGGRRLRGRDDRGATTRSARRDGRSGSAQVPGPRSGGTCPRPSAGPALRRGRPAGTRALRWETRSTGCRRSSPERCIAEGKVPPAMRLRVGGRLSDQATTHVAGHPAARPEAEPVRPLERSHGRGRQCLGHTSSVGPGFRARQKVAGSSPGRCSVRVDTMLD
jgi:hypothetical protein